MEDFYIVLPSNVGNLSGEKNETGHYKTYLPKPIILDAEKWKVALVDISFYATWYNITEETAKIEAKLPDVPVRTLSMRPGFYGCENALMRHINLVLSHLGIRGRFLKNPDTHLIRLKLEPGAQIRLHPIISSMLGFDENIFRSNEEDEDYIEADHPSNLDITVKHIYIYSDIVKHMVVGNTYAPLLQTIPARPIKHGDMTHNEFLNPHYLALQTGDLSVIEMRLCDEVGETIKFESGNVIVKLHFKQVV